jgi:hypothetical protein
MKLVKSLLLGSVAGLAAVAGAQAADLPVAKAAPVEYVRVCSTYGAGFFYIPRPKPACASAAVFAPTTCTASRSTAPRTPSASALVAV